VLARFAQDISMMTKNRPVFYKTAGLFLLLALGFGLHYAYEFAALGVAYKAKVLCSGVFLSKRSPEAILNEDLAVEDLAVLRLAKAVVNPISGQVSADFLGLVKQTAQYDEGLGCHLLFDEARPVGLAQRPALPDQTGQADLPSQPDGRLDKVLDWAFAEADLKQQRRTRAVVVLKNGKIVAERYAPGLSADMPLAGWSLAKSVMNALVGVLVGQGRLDLAAPAPVPEWQGENDPRRAITLDQLLRMVSGLAFSERGGGALVDVTRMLMREPDAAAFAAAKPLADPPGTRWAYASGTTNIISRIIRAHLGEAAYRDFPRQALFAPLGMDSARLETDASGTFVGSSFLYATARDWAKFGQLYLQDGVWQGRRILPAGWVRYSNTLTPLSKGEYAAHFWLDIAADYRQTNPGPPLPADAFHAMGYEGQCVSIIPSLGLVIVRLGLTRTAAAWRQDVFVHRIVAALN
jgi:hypothetical protein